jgi:predicted metal-binding protein
MADPIQLDVPVLPDLYVCTTCRVGAEGSLDAPRPGALLHEALQAANQASPSVRLLGVECLAQCPVGCSAAIAMPGKWTYLLGHLLPELAEDLLAYARLYAAARTGTVMPSRRPETLRDMIQGRTPGFGQSIAS